MTDELDLNALERKYVTLKAKPFGYAYKFELSAFGLVLVRAFPALIAAAREAEELRALVTYRVGSLNGPGNVGKTAKSPEIAKWAAQHLDRSECLVLERTVWEERDYKLKPVFTVIDEAEQRPGEWDLENALNS